MKEEGLSTSLRVKRRKKEGFSYLGEKEEGRIREHPTFAISINSQTLVWLS